MADLQRQVNSVKQAAAQQTAKKANAAIASAKSHANANIQSMKSAQQEQQQQQQQLQDQLQQLQLQVAQLGNPTPKRRNVAPKITHPPKL